MVTTIQLDESVKKKLDLMKIHSRETYNDVLTRILGNTKKIDEESLIETIDILSDPETMREIAEAIENYESGKSVPWEKIKKELRLNV